MCYSLTLVISQRLLLKRLMPSNYCHIVSTLTPLWPQSVRGFFRPNAVSCMSPQGVLRIHFLEALDLEGKDKFLGGLIKGKSDPYGVLQIGNQLFQSKTVKESLHPKWNEVYEVTSVGCLLEQGVTVYNSSYYQYGYCSDVSLTSIIMSFTPSGIGV